MSALPPILSVSTTITNIAKEPVVKHLIPGAKRLSRVSVPESLEHTVKLNKVVSKSSMKVIARFGLVGVMVGAVNELSEINTEDNKEYFISVGVKNGIYLGLLFSPAWVAFGGIVLTELIYYFLKDKIENSKIELYLYDSLLFNTTQHNDNRYFNDIEHSKSYRASIFLDVLKSSGKSFILKDKEIKASELKGFTSANEVREFIASNYTENKELMNSAMLNELSQLKSVLYGYSLNTKDNYNSTRISNNGMTINVNSANNVKLSKSLYESISDIYVSYDKADDKGVYKTEYKQLPIQQEYDITSLLVSNSDEFEKVTQHLSSKTNREKEIWLRTTAQMNIVKQILNNVSLIVISKDINFKYELIYHIFFQARNTHVNIQEIKTSSLNEEENKQLKDKK